MGKVHFYAVWSLREAPRQFIRNVNRMMYQVQMPLPLPKQLIVFGLGEWSSFSSDTEISVEVLLGPEVKSQVIGTLSPHSGCLIWQGVWTPELLTEAKHRGRRGVYAKVLLRITGQPYLKVSSSFISSTPRVRRKRLALNHSSNLSSTLLSSGESHDITQRSPPEGSVSCAELGQSKTETRENALLSVQGVWPMDKTPRRSIIGIKGNVWSSEEPESPWDPNLVSSLKKRKLCKMSAIDLEDETTVKRVKSCRADCPSKRWSHAMCLSDPETAVLIGGEADDQANCKDSIWKLEIDNDFWFPMDVASSEVSPPSSQGHSATFDPESKVIYVYGGLRDGQRYSDIYVLDTITWKWKLVSAKGNIPSLAYHSGTVYKKELYVFGGMQPSRCPEGKECSNALYIFNPEHGLWYQPIVEGDRPLPRFGHSNTLLSNKMIIFGGRKTATYLNDLHILDLGFMEYTAVKYENMPPLARGFHAALPVSDNRVLISGGCSAIGALQDLHLFNIDTSSWTSVVSPLLCSKPRAGHSLISLACTKASSSDPRDQRHGNSLSLQCNILVFGGSDCSGTFYNDTIKCTVELRV
ncbi:rab9 effector protein with kelch motifs isoform X1 [Rhinichthys klamathensis goyatoka]|uniref:rab9 effector protein with kelch motifs isoform X1 n=1 Tax=Rhinichthys klamathensis goyatoka TaxID=3034132 RepID=UPI0024B5B1DF|nr:rab9 effector protein with kelch motifs isoform X1 [Rhinichthys klamathensis goyatoka]